MAGSSSSSMTSTSHTLTHAPTMSFLSSFTDSSRPGNAADILALFDAIKSGNRHGFLQPTSAIPNASLQLAKSTLDAYAGQVSDEQQQRQRESNKKRKRAERGSSNGEILKIRKLHVDGFESGQVWQQARRIISSALQDSRETLKTLEEADEIEVNGENGALEVYGSDQASSEIDSDDDDDDEQDDSAEELSDSEGDEDDEEEQDEEEASFEGDELDGLEIANDEELAQEEIGDDDEDEEEEEGEFMEDPNGLNDGFFSIDAFNKESQWFEDQDAKADPNTDAGSDNEEVNWHADPLSGAAVINGKPSKSANGGIDEEMPSDDDEEDDEEDGPTFGDMSLDAPEGESDEDEAEDGVEDDMGEFNANDLFYKDFFAPPPKKGSKDRKPRKFKEPRATVPDDNDIDRAMADVRRDLFDDESGPEDSDDGALSDVSAGDPRSRRSAHERRQAKLAEEIRKLEAANVAEKKWTLAGEAKAKDRPKHSLLDEQLDFEHIGKPVPVITAEVSESIEDMIKRRILAQEFDEVVKRRPDSLDQSANTRRGLVEIDDSKAKQSLAELYEEEHVKTSNPDTYISKSDEKLRKEEQEIEQMWKEVSSKLDALSSWHYKPKPAAPSLTVVADVATIAMEDAQPTTAQGVSGGDHTLAPQEIYKAGKDTVEKGEVVAKSGLPVARQELSREEKTRRRRREKERIRKAGGLTEKKPLSGKAQAQKETMGDLKKGGVKVINKKGEVLDMEGNKAKTARAVASGNFKL